MPISPEIVRHIADLACLELSEPEVEQYTAQLSAILDYAERLKGIDTTGIPPTSSVLPPQTVLREDQPCSNNDREDILQDAPDLLNGQYKVPRVFDS